MSSKTASRKQKVDPASLLAIRTFIGFFDSADEMVLLRETTEMARQLRQRGIKSFERFYENTDDLKFALQLIDVAKPHLSIDGISGLLSDVKKQDILRSNLDPEVSLWLSFSMLNMVCLIVSRKSLSELYQEARNGKQKSLFELLRYDKTVLNHEWVQEKLFDEAIAGNEIFFENLGDAIKGNPAVGKHRQSRLKLILVHFWPPVFSKLTYQEQIELLNEAGFQIDDEVLYRKLVRTEVKPLFKQ